MFMLHIDPAHAAAHAAPTEPSAGDQRRTARARVEAQMAALARLVEIGMEIAEEAGRQARAPADERPPIDPGLTYSRVARAVRLTIALQTRLAKDLEALGRDEGSARRARIHRLVERVIQTECDERIEIAQLSQEVRERLRDEENMDELAGRPIGEIVARICQDLGLAPNAWMAELDAQDLPHPGEAPDVRFASTSPRGGRSTSSPSSGGWAECDTG